MAEALLLDEGLTNEIHEPIWRERRSGDTTDVYAFTAIEREGLMVVAAMHDDQMA
jgi:hypothetical protein